MKPERIQVQSNPGKALDIGMQLGRAAATKNSNAVFSLGMQAGKFGATGPDLNGKKFGAMVLG